MIYLNYEIIQRGNKIEGNVKVKEGQPISVITRRIFYEVGKQPEQFTLQNIQPLEQIKDNHHTLFFKQKQVKSLYIPTTKKQYSEDNSFFEETSEIFQNQSHKFLQHQPQRPPNVAGQVYKCSKIFSCLTSTRFMKLNLDHLSVYNDEKSQRPEFQTSILTAKFKPYRKTNIQGHHLYYLRITGSQTLDLRFRNIGILKQWMGYIVQAKKFSSYIAAKKTYCRSQSMDNFLKSLKQQEQNTRIVRLDEVDKQKQCQFSLPIFPEQLIQQQQQSIIVKLSQFKVTHKIGSGAFSTIYKAIKDGRAYALKQINKHKLIAKNQLKYAITELRILVKCRSCPFIIPIYYAFQTYQYLYLAIQYSPYPNLKQIIEKNGKLSPENSLKILTELIIAIQFLHEHKLLYRDLKPQNIIINEKKHIYLIDFGLSKQLLDRQTMGHSFLGTPMYLPPERFHQSCMSTDFRADIYGIGCIYYEMLHGYPPFHGQSFHQVAYKIRSEEAVIDGSLGQPIKQFINATLHKNPSKRLVQLRSHKLFKGIIWKKVQKKQYPLEIDLFENKAVQINYNIDEDYNEQNFSEQRVADWHYSCEH